MAAAAVREASTTLPSSGDALVTVTGSNLGAAAAGSAGSAYAGSREAHEAARKGELKALRALKESGCSMAEKDSWGRTAAHAAAEAARQLVARPRKEQERRELAAATMGQLLLGDT